MTVEMPCGAVREAFADAALDDVLELDHTQRGLRALGTSSGARAWRAMLSTARLNFRRQPTALRPEPLCDGIGGALRIWPPSNRPAHARLRGEGMKAARRRALKSRPRMPCCVPGECHDGTALGRLIASEASWLHRASSSCRPPGAGGSA